MIVRQFLLWIRNAPPGERAEAASALARAYLHSDLSAEDLAAAEGALIMLLDDPSPLVRRAMSEVFASADKAPPLVVQALAADQSDVALPLLARSPLLLDEDLVDLVATGSAPAHVAIASRAIVPRSLAAALAEVGSAEGCLALMENPDATIPSFSLDRIVERFGDLASIRENLLERDDLPIATRQAVLAKLSETLADFVAARQWLDPEYATNAAREACERATVELAAETPCEEVCKLVQHLRKSGQLTARIILRALLSGNIVFFEEALSELSGVPIERVTGYIRDRNSSALRALYARAALPELALPAFREAIMAMRDGALRGEPGGAPGLKRAMVERVLAACSREQRAGQGSNATPLFALLRRFAVEAARDEARLFCEDLVTQDCMPPMPVDDVRLVA